MRLPKRLCFPFGYVITFKYVTKREMKAACGEDLDGLWDVGVRTIYVVRGLPVKRLRYIIGHEMDHALNDYRLFCVNANIAQG